MPDEIIHCRLPSETLKKLDGHANALRKRGVPPRLATRSAIVRVLLSQQLNADPAASEALEVMTQAQRLLRVTTARALKQILERLPAELDAVAAQSSSSLKDVISTALHRVCDRLPDADAITAEALAETSPPLRKQ